MTSWHSYPSIFNLGHRAVAGLLTVPHVVEEKIDGSQFSFGAFADPEDGSLQLRVRSKGAVMHVDAPEKMFTKAVEAVKARLGRLRVGWTYRGEYLAKPKHNTLAYDRTPTDHVILFDVETGEEMWLTPDQKREEAARIGFECVPQLRVAEGSGTSLEDLRTLLDGTPSVLGGQLIEGVVIKPLVELYGPDKKTLMGKFVSERFKEAHGVAWKQANPQSGDVLTSLIAAYATPARWQKAVQHLRESGTLEDSPRDIGNLIIEVQKDLGQECQDEIMRGLWKWAQPHLSRGVIRGLPEWYKNELLRRQFEQEGDSSCTSASPSV